jgi:hypothetical protein
MFNSRAYRGNRQNPPWYVPLEQDPVAEIYQVYDNIVGQIRRSFPDVRLMIATGLHQEPHTKVTFYWRLKNHAAYLKKIGVPFASVSARMSRDFVVECDNEQQARIAAEVLASAKDASGQPLFEVDNRGRSLFAMLVWSNDIDQTFAYTVNGTRFDAFREDVAFVAIKNGEHHGTGYFMDTGSEVRGAGTFPLAQIPERICEAFGVSWRGTPASLDRLAS